MTAHRPGADEPEGAAASAHRVRLPGFISDKMIGGETVGLGDVIKRATSRAGIKPCTGCNHRAQQLNRWMTFSRRG